MLKLTIERIQHIVSYNVFISFVVPCVYFVLPFRMFPKKIRVICSRGKPATTESGYPAYKQFLTLVEFPHWSARATFFDCRIIFNAHTLVIASARHLDLSPPFKGLDTEPTTLRPKRACVTRPAASYGKLTAVKTLQRHPQHQETRSFPWVARKSPR